MDAFRSEFKTELVKQIPSLSPEQVNAVLGVFDGLTYNKYDMTVKVTALTVTSGYNQRIIEQYIATYYTRRKTAETARNVAYSLQKFFDTVGKDANKVDTADVLNFFLIYRAKGNKRLKPSSQNHYEQTLDCFYRWAVKNYKITGITENPMDCYEKATVPNERKGALTENELKQFSDACETERERIIIEFLAETGCRVAEMCHAKRDSFRTDLERDGEIPFQIIGKGNKADTYFISTELYNSMMLYWKTFDSDYAFGNEYGNPLNPCTTRRMINRIQNNSGITRINITPHTFRHTAATNLVRNGGTAYDVRLLLNHSSTTVSERYIEDDIERRRKVSIQYHKGA